MKDIAHVINYELFKVPFAFTYLQWQFIVWDSINSKLYKPLKLKPKKKLPENLCDVRQFSKQGS